MPSIDGTRGVPGGLTGRAPPSSTVRQPLLPAFDFEHRDCRSGRGLSRLRPLRESTGCPPVGNGDRRVSVMDVPKRCGGPSPRRRRRRSTRRPSRAAASEAPGRQASERASARRPRRWASPGRGSQTSTRSRLTQVRRRRMRPLVAEQAQMFGAACTGGRAGSLTRERAADRQPEIGSPMASVRVSRIRAMFHGTCTTFNVLRSHRPFIGCSPKSLGNSSNL